MHTSVRRIALIGLRTTGKSTVGKILAQQLGWVFLDLDEQLAALFAVDIRSWVDAHGWDAFRAQEEALLRRFTHEERIVLATGGGVVLRAQSRESLHKEFFVIWLGASPLEIARRLSQDPLTPTNRPPLTDLPPMEEIRTVLAERTPLYKETAHVILATDHLTPREVALTILETVHLGAVRC